MPDPFLRQPLCLAISNKDMRVWQEEPNWTFCWHCIHFKFWVSNISEYIFKKNWNSTNNNIRIRRTDAMDNRYAFIPNYLTKKLINPPVLSELVVWSSRLPLERRGDETIIWHEIYKRGDTPVRTWNYFFLARANMSRTSANFTQEENGVCRASVCKW